MNFERVYVCAVCRKPKPESLGKLKTSRTRHNTKYFVCDNCGLNTPVQRKNRVNQETPPEREVREALSGCGFKAEAEFKVDRFIYDFAVPKIRLLIEVDSQRYHRLPRQIKRDRQKDKVASQFHWKLVRLRTGSGLGTAVLQAGAARVQELGR